MTATRRVERSSAARAEGLSPRCPARRASAFAPPWGSIDGDNCCHTFYGRHIWHAEVLLWRSLPMATAVNCLYSWSSKIRVQTSSVFDVLNECIHLECTFLLTYWNLTMQHLLNSGVSTGATTCEFDFDLAHASLQHNVYGAKLTFDPVLVM
jgi:hypothetical protein